MLNLNCKLHINTLLPVLKVNKKGNIIVSVTIKMTKIFAHEQK
jgi:hypothetical protein